MKSDEATAMASSHKAAQAQTVQAQTQIFATKTTSVRSKLQMQTLKKLQTH